MIVKTKRGKYSIIIDDEDLNKINSIKWTVRTGSHGFKAPILYGLSGSRSLASFLLDTKLEVDHINGDPFDNRKLNLRTCTRSQNMFNRRIFKKNKSGFKGVRFDVFRNKWSAELRAYGKRFKKRFDTKEEAARFYNEMAKNIMENLLV